MLPVVKSPFIIIPEALSPLQCEKLTDSAEFVQLDVNKRGLPTATTKVVQSATATLHNVIKQYDVDIIAKYGSGIRHMEQTRITWINNEVDPAATCDNSAFIRNKWLRVHNRDLTAILFMSDFNDSPPFDGDFEVYGGKMEFPTHGFGFNPIRGTMIIMPSDPHFAHVFSKVSVGDCFFAKTFIQLEQPLIYTPEEFPGKWSEWLHDAF